MIQVYEEFRAQIDKVIAAGIEPSHIDSHESVYMYPDLFFKVVVPIARLYRLPIRLQQERMDREMFSDARAYRRYLRSEAFWKNHVMSALAHRYRAFLRRHRVRTTDHFLSTFSCLRRYPNDLTGGLARDLRELEPGTTELMVHPGYSDSRLENLLDSARWRRRRRDEGVLDGNGLHGGQVRSLREEERRVWPPYLGAAGRPARRTDQFQGAGGQGVTSDAGRRLRILHVLSGCTVGGCEQHVLALLARLDRNRYEPWLACFEAEPDDAAPMIPMFRAAGVRTIDLRARRRTDPAAFARFGRLLRRGHFDIVHVHSFRTELGATILGRVLGGAPRVVRTAHNVDEFYVSPRYGALTQLSARGLDRDRRDLGRRQRLPPRRGRPAWRQDRPHLLRHRPVAVSAGGAAALASPDADRSARPTLGVLARLAPQKGHRILFEALPEIVKAIPDLRVRIAGHEELSTVDELRAYAEQLGVAERVEFEGFCADVAALMADLDIIVLPSLWEGFGLVLLEAMAAGRPVVASAVGPIPEVVVDGVTGLLVPPGDRRRWPRRSSACSPIRSWRRQWSGRARPRRAGAAASTPWSHEPSRSTTSSSGGRADAGADSGVPRPPAGTLRCRPGAPAGRRRVTLREGRRD